MCRAVACNKCGRTTWAGCGEHVDQVMKNVAPADRCEGHEPAGAQPSRGAFGTVRQG